MFRRVAESTHQYEHLPNLQKVGPELWRGGQPARDGFVYLMDSGVKTVVNLREEQYSIDDERALVEELGLKYFSLPLRPFAIPERARIEQFLELMENADHHTVFVHCLHGMDRTGLMCAIYRMQIHDWSYEDSYSEMLKMGFHEAFDNLRQVVIEHARQIGKLPNGY